MNDMANNTMITKFIIYIVIKFILRRTSLILACVCADTNNIEKFYVILYQETAPSFQNISKQRIQHNDWRDLFG
jgi:hypothetical protein